MKKYSYRFYESILWIIMLVVFFISALITTIPYIITGKDYVNYIGKIYMKLLFKK